MINIDQVSNFPYYRYTSQAVIQRGQDYFRKGRVIVFDYQNDIVICDVIGSYGKSYEVWIEEAGKNLLNFSCTCPYAAEGHFCKHMVAAMLKLQEYLEGVELQSDWQYLIDDYFASFPRRKIHSRANRYVALLLMSVNEFAIGSNVIPYVVKAERWKVLKNIDEVSATINDLLAQNIGWHDYIDKPYQTVNPQGCLNLSLPAVGLFNMLLEQGGYYGYKGFVNYLELIKDLDIPVFLEKGYRSVGNRLAIHTTPQEIKAAMIRDDDKLSMEMGVQFGDKLKTPTKGNLNFISLRPPWILVDDQLLPVANPESVDILEYFPLEIPIEDENIFRKNYFLKIAERIPIESDVVEWNDVHEDAVPRLYLYTEEDTLRADLRFGYGEYEVAPEKGDAPVTTLDNTSSWTLTRVKRQKDCEHEFYQMLKDSKYGLKRAKATFPYGTFEIRARTHPFDFLTQCIPALTEAGYEIYGDKDALGKVNPNKPSISLNITTGIDWFELDAVVMYGEQEVKLREIHKMLRKGNRYVKLADGSIGQIPEKWLARYSHIFDMAEEEDGVLHLSDMQLSLVDELLEDADNSNVVDAFHEKRERLKNFKDIQSQPMPQGFTGKLRPYQKAGLDWLHFLSEYDFGGILADDMGLGKTIQMLAFFQAQNEAGCLQHAALLVVPKSLLANWQREAARFAPSLRILEYVGNSRKKDITAFAEYDIVLTTYGTMLRDIEILCEYRFSYAVLDESQAIKNPMAQSSKAARLINADHRLCMTGTPVENNTFELWAQIAFVNPGLLGSLTYFKKEFARPIESQQDEDIAQLLKRMVYPFILRRTKEQVAPELPPRTERIIYIDLEPAQRRLYDRTRDYYRAQLLGMIEESGVNNARMKILEGLLRLRQICIHPLLVEPAYKKKSAKFLALMETLETLQSKGHKTLIFSQFVQSLKILETKLKDDGFSYVYLDGKTRKRQEQVDKFQDDPTISFFLISLKAGGVGLNLTAADYVIHLDPWWNPAVEMQAADRAHRIGQDKPVFVYKFIARDTVEEKILELQNRKKELVKQLISSETSFFKSLTGDDVNILFS